MNLSWRPGATIPHLRKRAALLAQVRTFFAERDVWEVETPILSAAASTSPALHSLHTRYQGPGAAEGRDLWLHTSPEHAMKRLLAAGSGAIYQICHVFRDGEAGRRHNPEFTLVEWYRPGFSLSQLMDEVEALVADILPSPTSVRMSYDALFLRYAGVSGLHASSAELRACLEHAGIAVPATLDADDLDGWRDLVLSLLIEPQLPDGGLFVYDYPASQAALARVRDATDAAIPVAERFEFYYDGVELANGFHELADAGEQSRRFDLELAQRADAGLAPVPRDEALLSALAAGLPDACGVALGFDRLCMLALGANHIEDVLAFGLARA